MEMAVVENLYVSRSVLKVTGIDDGFASDRCLYPGFQFGYGGFERGMVGHGGLDFYGRNFSFFLQDDVHLVLV